MTPEKLSQATGCTLLRAAVYASALAEAMARHEINTPLRQAAFLGQIAHESARLSVVEENLNYSAERLCAVWPSRFPTPASAQPFARNPEALANKVYGGRMGNTAPGSGWKFRGRGLKQLTGHDNYKALTAATGIDFVSNPDLLTQPAHAAMSAAWFWKANGCNALADKKDWASLTRKINGGTLGLAERIALTERAMKVLGA